ncbi:hypothetical protein [Permianibacter aggregans]|uniref:hypothetical protein n=1 Tax=Permianibacter aggregans TaxID=1510150 RepID=UPI00105E01CE|nr:hypothetical protein [Permianibacter aggregans]QGX38968.1 hypothetical protein E2H98_04550 [Permianibacter aggregans]
MRHYSLTHQIRLPVFSVRMMPEKERHCWCSAYGIATPSIGYVERVKAMFLLNAKFILESFCRNESGKP